MENFSLRFNRWKSCLINQKCFSIIFLHNKADLNEVKEKKGNFSHSFLLYPVWESFLIKKFGEEEKRIDDKLILFRMI